MYNDLKPELIYYAENTLLEGPHWDDENNLLYFVSITDNMIYCLNDETKEIHSYPTSGPVGAAVLDKKGKILSAEKSGIYSIDLETKERTFLTQPSKNERLRYNDGKLDPRGRFLIGTMGYEETIDGAASLFVIEGEEYKELLTGLTLSNGLDWSKNGRTFYHIDTPTRKIKQYDYDLDTAEVSNEQTVIEIKDGGVPDGMCVDVDGKIWVAEYGGKKVCKWNPATGDKILEIPMPVSNITSCCLGGINKNYLYVTTAKEDGEPLSGGLFRVEIR